jgi:hypothetical protein
MAIAFTWLVCRPKSVVTLLAVPKNDTELSGVEEETVLQVAEAWRTSATTEA